MASRPIKLYVKTTNGPDKLFIAVSNYSGAKLKRYSVVLYGNVMGSQGAVGIDLGSCELLDWRSVKSLVETLRPNLGGPSLLDAFRKLTNLQAMTAFLVIVGSGIWQFQRVVLIRPAILGDEYIYSANSRLTEIWGSPIQGDFSNYLFNFVYKSTLLCGDGFYTCAKGLNVIFFSITLAILLGIALYLSKNPWLSIAVVGGLSLSPVSIYVSLFLPETLFFFLLTVTLHFLLKSAQTDDPRVWSMVGASLGLAALVKPHAFLSLPAIAVYALCMNLASRASFKTLLQKAAWFFGSLVIVRVVLGLLVGGPQTLGLAGQYLGATAVANLTQTEGRSAEGGAIAQSILELFVPMISYHWAATIAIFALPVSLIMIHLIVTVKAGKSNQASAAALLALIWLLSLIVIVALFTGYVTGTGDDHSTRMLLRYYEFLYLFLPVIGLASATSVVRESNLAMWPRVLVVSLLTPGLFFAFGGMFDVLTVQIADAPTLAGLIPNFQIFSAVSVFGLLSLGLILFWPSSLKYALVVSAVLVATATGFETMNQYQIARGYDNYVDIGGKATAEFLLQTDEANSSEVLVLAQSRFDATNAAFWIDRPNTTWEYFGPGVLDPSSQNWKDVEFILSLGGVQLSQGFQEISSGENWTLYRRVEGSK